jgi:hypothetical protein
MWNMDKHSSGVGSGDAADLLPGGPATTRLVLFVDPADAGAADARDRFRSASVRYEVPTMIVDVAEHRDVARWFGIRSTPVLAVVHDGALLALSTECGAGECDAAIALAMRQLGELDR